MKMIRMLIILVPVIASCDKRGEQVQLQGKICELHHQALKSVSGYLPGPEIMVSPGYGVTEFRVQFGESYPHNRHPYLSSTRGDGWTKAVTLEVCEECEKKYSEDFATYLKIDEEKREEQWMDFIMKHREDDHEAISPSSDTGESLLPDD